MHGWNKSSWISIENRYYENYYDFQDIEHLILICPKYININIGKQYTKVHNYRNLFI